MDRRRPMTKEEIYDKINGLYASEYYDFEFENRDDVVDEFEIGGACYDLYSNVYEARERIAERTGIDFEDEDIMTIVESLEEIARILSLKMYDYGAMNANSHWENELKIKVNSGEAIG